MGIPLKFAGPSPRSLFDNGEVVPNNCKVGYVADRWIIEQSACGEFLIIKQMGIP
jgi:hypothetical protein